MEEKVKKAIRDVVDFPKKGIVFKDITPLLSDPKLTREITAELAKQLEGISVDAVMGIESRGFFWGLLLAQALDVPFIPARKKGKLPYKTVSYEYELEYGTAEIEIHEDAVKAGQQVLVHDDLLATGGTAMAAAELIQSQQAKVAGFSFIVNLSFLKGSEKLKNYSENLFSLATY